MNEEIEKHKKKQKYYFIAAPLITFLATMKYLDVFSIGSFPAIVELGMAAYCLLAGFYIMNKVKKLELIQSKQ